MIDAASSMLKNKSSITRTSPTSRGGSSSNTILSKRAIVSKWCHWVQPLAASAQARRRSLFLNAYRIQEDFAALHKPARWFARRPYRTEAGYRVSARRLRQKFTTRLIRGKKEIRAFPPPLLVPKGPCENSPALPVLGSAVYSRKSPEWTAELCPETGICHMRVAVASCIAFSAPTTAKSA